MKVGSGGLHRQGPNFRWAVTRITVKDEQPESSILDVTAAFRGITSPMAALGMPRVLATPKIATKKKRVYPLVVFALFAYAVRLIVALCDGKRMLSSFRLLLALGHVFRCITSFLSAAHMVLHRESFRELVVRFNGVFGGCSELHTRQLARFTKFFASFCVTSSIVLWIALLASVFGVHRKDAFPAQYHRGNESSVPKSAQGIVVFVDTVLLALSKSMSSLTIVFFAALCHMLASVTLRFKLAVESATACIDSGYGEMRVIEGLLRRLSLISDAVFALNHTYGAIMSLWYADLTASFLFSLPSLILGATGGAELSEYAFALVDITRDAAVFVILTFVASNVAKNVSDSLGYALRMANPKMNRGFAFSVMVKNLVCHIQDARVQLSGADFFEVDRALVNKVLSLVATFAIILYQFLS